VDWGTTLTIILVPSKGGGEEERQDNIDDPLPKQLARVGDDGFQLLVL